MGAALIPMVQRTSGLAIRTILLRKGDHVPPYNVRIRETKFRFGASRFFLPRSGAANRFLPGRAGLDVAKKPRWESF